MVFQTNAFVAVSKTAEELLLYTKRQKLTNKYPEYHRGNTNTPLHIYYHLVKYFECKNKPRYILLEGSVFPTNGEVRQASANLVAWTWYEVSDHFHPMVIFTYRDTLPAPLFPRPRPRLLPGDAVILVPEVHHPRLKQRKTKA